MELFYYFNHTLSNAVTLSVESADFIFKISGNRFIETS